MRDQKPNTTSEGIRALTDEEMNAVLGGMKAEFYVGNMHMTINASAGGYGVVVSPYSTHECVGFSQEACDQIN
jgi:hypothetical protein